MGKQPVAVALAVIAGRALRGSAIDAGAVILEQMDRELERLGADTNVDYVLVGVPQGHANSTADAIAKALRVKVER